VLGCEAAYGRLQLFQRRALGRKRVMVYVDGFNLYYGIRDYPHAKWLNLDALCRLLLPNHHIQGIKYFTAPISAPRSDPRKPQRQQTYWRALRTIPQLDIIVGLFISNPIQVRPIVAIPGGPSKITIMKTEEKGSDVNIATHLMLDAFDSIFEIAAVISNDSDLAFPISVVRTRFGRDVIVFNPHQRKPKRPSRMLQSAATQVRDLRKGPICASQFPATLSDPVGVFTKPLTW